MFLLFYDQRCIFYCSLILILFILFCFHNLKLNYILLLLPISFIVWIINLYIYHYKTFFIANQLFLSNILIVKSNTKIETSAIITMDASNLSFELIEPTAQKNDITISDLPGLVSAWYTLNVISIAFLKYERILSFVSTIILLLSFL